MRTAFRAWAACDAAPAPTRADGDRSAVGNAGTADEASPRIASRKITLEGVDSPVWRRVDVALEATIERLRLPR